MSRTHPQSITGNNDQYPGSMVNCFLILPFLILLERSHYFQWISVSSLQTFLQFVAVQLQVSSENKKSS